MLLRAEITGVTAVSPDEGGVGFRLRWYAHAPQPPPTLGQVASSISNLTA